MALMVVIAAPAWQEVAVPTPTLARCRQPRAIDREHGQLHPLPNPLINSVSY